MEINLSQPNLLQDSDMEFMVNILLLIIGGYNKNPQLDLQAQHRAHRISQKKEVQVFRFCIEVYNFVPYYLLFCSS